MSSLCVASASGLMPRAASSIYLDSAATTRVDRRVIEAVISTMANDMVGNAHARQHAFGVTAHNLIEHARSQVAASLGCEAADLAFTSGATEANNLIVQGLVPYLRAIGKTHIVTSAVEHKSVLQTILSLESQGFSVTVLPVKPCAMVEAKALARAVNSSTGLVSIQAVNNETGTVQPLAEIAAVLQGRDILFHTDAAQAIGKMQFSVSDCNVDFASLSAHKLHGPQGIGAVFIHPKHRKALSPILWGGGQENGLRSGTLPTALCVGFGLACSLIENKRQYLQGLRQSFLTQISQLKPIVYGHSDPEWNVPGILNLRFAGIDSETMVMALPQLAIGTGAACSHSGTTLSHVIKAITNCDQAALEALRLSFDRMTTQDDINQAASQFIAAITSIRHLQGAD